MFIGFERMKTLYAFAKENGLPRSSVHARARDMGIDTANKLSEEDQARLLVEFGKAPKVEEPQPHSLVAPCSIVPDIVEPGAILLPNSGGAMAYQQYIHGAQANAQQRTGALNNMAMAYAQGRFAQVFADIDMVAATVRANALNAVEINTQPAK
jgi:hypothetical protein